MEYLNIIEKLKLLLELISKNYLFIALLAVSLTVFIINRLKLISTKKMGLIITLTFVLCFSIILFYNSNNLFKMFDNIANLIFRNIYFPSIYVYVSIILITNIILIMSIVSKNINKTYKNINLFLSFIINFLFLILINTIGNDEIDILSQTSMYTNNYFVSLIELTTSLFILWLMILLLISIIKSILSLIDNKKLELEPVKVINPTLNTIELDFNNNNDDLEGVETHPINPDSNTVMIINDIDSKQADDDINVEINKNIPADKVVNQGFDFNDFIKKDNILLDELKTNKTGLDKLMSIKPIKPVEDNNYVNLNPNTINNNFINPVLEENDSRLDIEKIIPSINVSNENETERVKDKYTKEDYKLFYDILNQVRANNDGKSIVTMDDALSVNLLNKFSIKQYNLYKKMLEDIRGC